MKTYVKNKLSKFKAIGLFVFTLFSTSLVLSQDGIVVLQRGGLFSSDFTVNVPAGAPAIVSRETGPNNSTRIYIASGTPALQIAGQKETTPELVKFPKLNFSDLRLLIDGSGKKIAAAYPLQQNRRILLTALHALQNARFEIPETESQKHWGLRDPKTDLLLDIAIVTSIEDEGTIKHLLAQAIDSNDEISSGYVDHLNVVDQHGELMLSRSVLQFSSSNEDYIFYKNSQNSMIGYASSGAIIYNEKSNKAHSIVTCASKVPLNAEESILRNRALKLNTILRYQLTELTPELIDGFQKLPCDPQDGRGAGGP